MGDWFSCHARGGNGDAGPSSAAGSASPPTDDRTGDQPRESTISVGFSSFFLGGGRKPELTPLLFTAETGDFEKKRPVAASNDDLRQPPKTATSRKPISIKDVAFRTSFGLGPEKTENQGPNRERKAGRWGESMVRRGALERCETGANPLETRGKRKPVTPENDPRETGLSFVNGGGAVHLIYLLMH